MQMSEVARDLHREPFTFDLESNFDVPFLSRFCEVGR
jgi:hypothetical protein